MSLVRHLRRTGATLALAAIVLATAAASARAATLEVPQNGGDASGIGYVSGWKCPPNDDVSLVIDGGAPIPVPSRARRNDTAGVCGNDGRNGYITQPCLATEPPIPPPGPSEYRVYALPRK